MDQPPPLLANNDHIEISESINNGYDYYSNGFLQPEDTFQQNPCSCNNCLSTASNFQLPYDNDNINYMNVSVSPPLMQQNIIDQNSPTPSIKEQCIVNDQQQFLEQVQPQTVPNISSPNNHHHHLRVNSSSSTTINSKTSYTELFRVEISGVEIIFRKKILLNLNHNLEMRNSPQNEHPPGIRAGRIQNRVHPYQMPAGENCRYNKINYRNPINPNSIQKHYYNHLSSMSPQLNQQIIDSYQ